ncbi:hypothetical protein [Pseudogulbenkiania subflava]|uniref:Uncharacterized protein n=1 Tax=Pseudogulbenkiania subflava DSM 22618 TaxID=1123014 RepID=A0A1Y6CFV3_9NEIS|nr:hypothetical protein [Pseudogulbenkiania subflava]SMF52951.1 hypothetical protein SAMN02745746_03780 [Pseudogulbenkiania subflava DSM 22618]
MNRSNLIIEHLKMLPQFMPAGPQACIDTRTGARIIAPVDKERAADGYLALEFPGGKMIEVIGDQYFRVQLVSAVEIWIAHGQVTGDLESNVRTQMKHFHFKMGRLTGQAVPLKP